MRTKPLTYIYGLYRSRSQTLVGRLATKLPTDQVEAKQCEPVHHDGLAFQVIRLQHLWGECSVGNWWYGPLWAAVRRVPARD